MRLHYDIFESKNSNDSGTDTKAKKQSTNFRNTLIDSSYNSDLHFQKRIDYNF